jgi:hypothetical protein
MSEEKKELTFFDRLKIERDELMEKHINLSKFLSTKNPEDLKIPDEEWFLLRQQEMVMRQYGFILERRINLIAKRFNELKENNNDTVS